MKLSRPLILLALAAVLPLIVLAAALGAIGLRQEQRTMETDARAQVDLASVLVQQDLDRQVAVLTAVTQSHLFDGAALDLPAITSYLDRIAATQPFWRVIFLSDAQGRRLVAAPSGLNYPDRVVDQESHKALLGSGKPTIGRIMRRPNGLFSFAVRVPVVRGGRTIYVLSALVDPEGLRRLYLANPLPENWRAGLIDASGRVVVRINAPQEAIGGFAPPDTLKIRRQSASGFYPTMSLEGDPMISAFRMLPGYGWSIHAAIPYDVYQAPVTRAIWLLVGATVLALALAVLFLWLLLREMSLRQREAQSLEEGLRMEALGRMTGGVAHDFNNLLMIVQGSAEMLKRRRAEPERVGSFADAILTAAHRGQTLTRQLLAFARRSAYEPVDFRLQDRAGALEEMIRRSVGDKVFAAVAAPSGLWPLRADPDALEIALINLAVNARDAMPEGGALTISAVNVTLRPDRASTIGLEGDFVAISVKDSGSGIPEEHLGHIFEPFYTTKPMGRGTGLGLSQVYGFARQSGGTVTVASKRGEGATFTLYLPRGALEPAPAAAPDPMERTTGEPGRLLLVEDDPDVAQAVAAMLTSGGYAVVRVDGAAAAMSRIEGGGFDVVLTDLLADRSGRGLAAALRRDRPELPVLLMTGRSDGFAAEPDVPVLMKPFGRAEALVALAQVRADTRRAAQPRTARAR